MMTNKCYGNNMVTIAVQRYEILLILQNIMSINAENLLKNN